MSDGMGMSHRRWTYIIGLLLPLTSSGILSQVYNVTDEPRNEWPTPNRINFTISDEKRLTQYLLWKYSVAGRGGRPVLNSSQPTTVEFGLGLIQMSLDERTKTLMTSMWSRLKWQDVYLTWNPSDFGGVRTVRLESDQVWLPDIMLYNTADPENGARNALIVVFHDGTVQWVPHQLFRSSCSIDVTNFPFDEQQCHMWFGSWTHTLPDIDLRLSFDGGIDLTTFQSDYKDSCEWDILSTAAERKLLPPDDPKPVAVVTFTLKLRRKRVFSSYILTLPCIILAVLTLVVFWLPADRPDRTSLAMSLLTSFLLLLLILVEAAPPTASSVPLLGVYYCFNMVIITLSILLSTTVVNISRAGQKGRPPPQWLRTLMLQFLARLVCIYPEGCRQRCVQAGCDHCRGEDRRGQARTSEDRLGQAKTADEGRAQPNVADDEDGRLFLPEERLLTCRSVENGSDVIRIPPPTSTARKEAGSVHAMIEDVQRSVHALVQLVGGNERRLAHGRCISAEWRDIGIVLDRLFFCMYVAIVVISLVTLSPKPTNATFFWEDPQ